MRKTLSKTLKTVGHPTRNAILQQLKKGPKTTIELEQALHESRYNLYHHLDVLQKQGLVSVQLKGRVKVYKLVKQKKEPLIIESAHLSPRQRQELEACLKNLFPKEFSETTSFELIIIPKKGDSSEPAEE